jgi:NagD protein
VVGDEQLWTSAVATAHFISSQRPGGTVFVIGQSSMHEAVAAAGLREANDGVDYVVIGESHDYSYESIERAVGLVGAGSRLVATNPERVNVNPDGLSPGCGALAAMVQSATGVEPYYVGKPNPVMIREGLNILGAHSKSTAMIGDRMDTDIRAGVESGLETILVLSGATSRDDVGSFAFQPSRVVESVADLVGALGEAL